MQGSAGSSAAEASNLSQTVRPARLPDLIEGVWDATAVRSSIVRPADNLPQAADAPLDIVDVLLRLCHVLQQRLVLLRLMLVPCRIPSTDVCVLAG
jgi:hypothetical protein